MAPNLFQMSKKDGKSVLLKAVNSKGFHTLKSTDYSLIETGELAEKACPVHIISVKET
jgi:ferredoxin